MDILKLDEVWNVPKTHAYERLKRRLRVNVVADTGLVEIRFHDTAPTTAAEVPNILALIYRERTNQNAPPRSKSLQAERRKARGLKNLTEEMKTVRQRALRIGEKLGIQVAPSPQPRLSNLGKTFSPLLGEIDQLKDLSGEGLVNAIAALHLEEKTEIFSTWEKLQFELKVMGVVARESAILGEARTQKAKMLQPLVEAAKQLRSKLEDEARAENARVLEEETKLTSALTQGDSSNPARVELEGTMKEYTALKAAFAKLGAQEAFSEIEACQLWFGPALLFEEAEIPGAVDKPNVPMALGAGTLSGLLFGLATFLVMKAPSFFQRWRTHRLG